MICLQLPEIWCDAEASPPCKGLRKEIGSERALRTANQQKTRFLRWENFAKSRCRGRNFSEKICLLTRTFGQANACILLTSFAFIIYYFLFVKFVKFVVVGRLYCYSCLQDVIVEGAGVAFFNQHGFYQGAHFA